MSQIKQNVLDYPKNVLNYPKYNQIIEIFANILNFYY
jgi:hypothetical protein